MRFSLLSLGPLRFVTRRLRHLIVVPYLILATLLAATLAYLLMSAASQSLTDRFNAQLLDAAQSGGARLVQEESQQLQALRAIAFTQGFAGAVHAGDGPTLRALAGPQAANFDLDSVLIISKESKVLAMLPQESGSDPPTQVSDELAPIVHAALNPSGDTDKVSATVAGRDGGEGIFYTAGPIRDGDSIVGALLVGKRISIVLKEIGRDSLSDGTTFYGSTGAPLAGVQAGSPPEGTVPSLPPLPAGWYEEISAGTSGKVRVRELSIGGETYVEAFAPVPGNGLGGRPPGIYGVMLRTHALDAYLDQTLWAALPVFVLGLVLILIVGVVLASGIERPLRELVSASGRVARGDLEVQVPVSRIHELGLLGGRFNEMVRGLRQLLVVKDLFGRFVSPEVSAKLLAGQIELGGELREVTILFSDLRDFTELSARHTPAETVDLLNEYFSIVVRAAAKHGGIVNKFGGDSTLVVFGAPVDTPDHAEMALATALEMDSALEELSARRVKAGWMPLRQGIGINTGTVVAGQIGSVDRMEYTVIGDAVNVASRLQAATKGMGECTILFSASTLQALSDLSLWRWVDKGALRVHGKKEPVRIYSLVGSRAPAELTDTAATAGGYEPGLTLQRGVAVTPTVEATSQSL